MLLALGGLAVPVAIHLIGRRQGRPVPFAAMQFLMASERRLAARRRIKNILLFALRAALITAVALAVARPVLHAPVSFDAGPLRVVALVDRSASTRRLMETGESLYELSAERLDERLAALPAGSEVAVVAFAREPELVTNGFEAPHVARQALGRIEPSYARGRGIDALREAQRLLEGAAPSGGQSGGPQPVILVASDLQATSWEGADFDSGVPIMPLVGPSELAGANRALVAASLRQAGAAWRVDVELARAGAEGKAVEGVALADGERLLARDLVELEAGEEAASVSLSLPQDLAAEGSVIAKLMEADRFAEDDERHVFLERAPHVAVLAVNGAPAATYQSDELFYLSMALRARADAPPAIELDVVDGTAGRLPELAAFDVVLLANVEGLTPRSLEELERFVDAGGGLWLTLGDRVDREHWNTSLARLLPASIGPPGAGPGDVKLRAPDPEDPLVAPVAGLLVERGHGVRLDRMQAATPVAGAKSLIVLPDGRPLIVAKPFGKGQVLLLTTSLDRDWSDFAVQPIYLPLAERALVQLAGGRRARFERSYLVGDRVVFPVEAGGGLQVSGPTGGSLAASPDPGGAVFAATFKPGLYRALASDGRRWDFVVNLDPAESDMRLAELAPAASGLGSPGHSDRRPVRADLSGPLALAALAILVAEAWLARSRASRRAWPAPAPAAAGKAAP